MLFRLFIVAFILIESWGVAQEMPEARTGIFLSQRDLMLNNISMLAMTDMKNSLELRADDVILLREGVKIRYKFGEIGGYYKNGYRYRCHGDRVKWFGAYGYYKIVDEADLIVYSIDTSGGKTWYYYSKALDLPIKRIIPKNIRNDFSMYPDFVKLALTAIKKGTIVDNNRGKTILNELYAIKVKDNQGQ